MGLAGVEVMAASQDMTQGGKAAWGEEVFFSMHPIYIHCSF